VKEKRLVATKMKQKITSPMMTTTTTTTMAAIMVVIMAMVMMVTKVEALQDTKQVKANLAIHVVGSFGYKKNGTATLSSDRDLTKEGVKFYLCSSVQWSDFVGVIEQNSSQICDPNFKVFCEIEGVPVNGTILDDYHVATSDRYEFVIVNCGEKSQTFDFTYILLNPGGQELSVGDEPIPDIYAIFCTLWMLLVTLWLLDRFVRRLRSIQVSRYNSCIALVLLLKLWVCLLSYMYWSSLSRVGHSTEMNSALNGLLFATSEAIFFLVLMLLAKGWKITCRDLPSSETRGMVFGVLFLLGALLFFSFYNNGYYLLSLVILYFFMLPKIFTGASQNVRLLYAHIIIMTREQPDENADLILTLRAKMRMFEVLRTTVMIYLSLVLFVIGSKILLPYKVNWITYLFFESLVFIVVLTIAFILHPSRTRVFAELELSELSNNLDLHSILEDYNHFIGGGSSVRLPKIQSDRLILVKVSFLISLLTSLLTSLS